MPVSTTHSHVNWFQVHFLGDSRGGALESSVCRMKTLRSNETVLKSELPASRMRMVAISATLPNLQVCV